MAMPMQIASTASQSAPVTSRPWSTAMPSDSIG
jgi:hypothetical protein